MALRTNGDRPITHTDGAPDNPATRETDRPKEESALDRAQRRERDRHFGREQGGNQQGNQRGLGNPGDR